MTKRFVIFAPEDAGRGDAWRIGVASGREGSLVTPATGPDASPEAVADALCDRLRAEGYAGEGVHLALPSGWCLCAPVSTAELPRRGREAALLYRLEEKLPLAAEELAADFLGHEDQALGVATEAARIAPWLEALEARGIGVEAVSPAAMLALQAREGNDPSAAAIAATGAPDRGVELPPPDVSIFCHAGRVELFVLAGGPAADKTLPVVWQSAGGDGAAEAAALTLRVRALHVPGTQRVRLHAPDTDARLGRRVADALAAVPGVELEQREESLADAAIRAGGELLAGRGHPWIDLRRGPLQARDPHRAIRRPLAAAGLAAALFLVALSASLFWRAHRYGALAADYARQERAVFEAALPGQPVPLGVRRRLESEETRLRGMQGASGEVPRPASSLALLRTALAGLPPDLRFRVSELRLEGERVYLEGQARSHGDADAIAASLRKTGTLSVEPPRTEKLAGQGVAFTMSGSAAEPGKGPIP